MAAVTSRVAKTIAYPVKRPRLRELVIARKRDNSVHQLMNGAAHFERGSQGDGEFVERFFKSGNGRGKAGRLPRFGELFYFGRGGDGPLSAEICCQSFQGVRGSLQVAEDRLHDGRCSATANKGGASVPQ